MTVQTTTLPAANPIRLGSQPIRRRALTPRVVEADAGPPEEQQAPAEEQAPQQPETDVVAVAAADKPRGRAKTMRVYKDVAVQLIPDVMPSQENLATLGQAVVWAAKCGLTLEEYIGSVRGMVAAYDRLHSLE